MKLLLLVIISFSIMGCCSQNSITPTQGMKINFIEKTINNKISLNESVLQTNNAIVENWPFKEPFCEKCSSKEKIYFTPKGPEKRVSVYDNNSLIAFALESHSSIVKFNDFTFSSSENGSLKICDAEKCETLKKLKKYKLSNCTIILTDYQYSATTKGIADSNQLMFKIAGVCQ